MDQVSKHIGVIKTLYGKYWRNGISGADTLSAGHNGAGSSGYLVFTPVCGNVMVSGSCQSNSGVLTGTLLYFDAHKVLIGASDAITLTAINVQDTSTGLFVAPSVQVSIGVAEYVYFYPTTVSSAWNMIIAPY